MAEALLKHTDTPYSRNLVYTSAGVHAQIRRWLKGRKDFDLWITAYDNNSSLKGMADYYNERRGGKFPNLYHAMQTWPELFERYKAVYVSDDDLHISGSNISALFKIRDRYNLYVLQPAFNQTGKVSHSVTRARLFSYLRYTNFVEVTCPLFRFDKLKNFMEFYDPMLVCHGVDYWFIQHVVKGSHNKAAIVDAISALNPPDASKGGREISKLQSDQERLQNWGSIKSSRNLHEINPMITWSQIRQYASPNTYLSTVKILYSKVNSRLQKLV